MKTIGVQSTYGRALLVLLLACGFLWPQPATCQLQLQRPETCHSCVPRSDREELAVGFHLGQSYGVSVNLLDNGTVVNLATVPGSRHYVELIERIMVTPPPRYGRLPNGISATLVWAVKHYVLGISPPRDTTIPAELVAELKRASEGPLGRSLDGHAVSITAPWQHFWRDQGSWSSDINDALLQSGLRPWFPSTMDPVYLDEVRTTLAACGRWLCQPFECFDPGEDHGIAQHVYYISFTNRSLYTTFARQTCFYRQPHEKPGTIDNHLGLDHLQNSPPDEYWNALRERLYARAGDFQGRRWPAKLVVVAGEAAGHPEFLSIVRGMAEGLPNAISDPPESQGDGVLGAGAELVVPGDPLLAPATGAALWSRLKVESGSYCETSDDCCHPTASGAHLVTWEMPGERDEL